MKRKCAGQLAQAASVARGIGVTINVSDINVFQSCCPVSPFTKPPTCPTHCLYSGVYILLSPSSLLLFLPVPAFSPPTILLHLSSPFFPSFSMISSSFLLLLRSFPLFPTSLSFIPHISFSIRQLPLLSSPPITLFCICNCN